MGLSDAHRLAFGWIGYDLAHLLGGVMLVLSFGLLYQRRLGGAINLYGMQAVALSAAAAWQGYVQDSVNLYLTAVITLAAKGVAMTLALHSVVRRLNIHRTADTALGIFPSMVLGVAVVVLSIAVVLPTTVENQVLTREDLATALSIVMLGLLVMITRRSAVTQVIGFLSLENGLILAAVGVAGMPLVVELSIAVLVMLAFIVFGVFVFRIRERFDSVDVSHLDRVGGLHR